MRKLALALVSVAALTGGSMGCGGKSTRLPLTGKAGANGAAGASAAGRGAAGTTGSAGTAAGGDGMVTGAAGEAAGTDGGAGTGAMPLPCDTKAKKPLPYAIADDFKVAHILTNGSPSSWKNIASPTCDATTFPPFPVVTTDGGLDAAIDGATVAGTDAGTDGVATDGSGAADTATLQLTDPDASEAATDGGVTDAATDFADGPAPDSSSAVVAIDAKADASDAAAASCYEFSYDPDQCVAAGGGACWAGVIFQTSEGALGSATPGVCIQLGAMSIEFWARSSRDGARVKFGSIREGLDSTERFFNITTTWTKYTIPIPASDQQTYDTSSVDVGGGVWNGFSVVVEPQDHTGGSYILVKDVVWKAL